MDSTCLSGLKDTPCVLMTNGACEEKPVCEFTPVIRFGLTPTEPPRFHFVKPENYISMYHQEGTNTLYVGGQAVIFVLTFTDRGVRDLQVSLASSPAADASSPAVIQGRQRRWRAQNISP